MKQTNYQLVDFLDFDAELNGKELLWIAGAPQSIAQEGSDIVLEVPFQRQLPGVNIMPDRKAGPQNFQLRMRAYGGKILRLFISFEGDRSWPDSPMLEPDASLTVMPLAFEQHPDEWLVKDGNGQLRARLNRKTAIT